MTQPGQRTVLVPVARIDRWLENFAARHGSYEVTLNDAYVATAADGAVARLHRPWALPPVADLAVLPAVRWGVLLVRRGGFAVAAGTEPTPAYTKVGKRHVQGQTKAGGWSQQRFARRRDNQAREAFEAAADHAERILLTEHGGVDALVVGGDRKAVADVLSDGRLSHLNDVVTEPWLPVPDPNAKVLAAAVVDAWSIRVEITDSPTTMVLP